VIQPISSNISVTKHAGFPFTPIVTMIEKKAAVARSSVQIILCVCVCIFSFVFSFRMLRGVVWCAGWTTKMKILYRHRIILVILLTESLLLLLLAENCRKSVPSDLFSDRQDAHSWLRIPSFASM